MTTTLFCLHALGASARSFEPLRHRLAGTLDVVGIDLPGFGASSAAAGTTVEEMAVFVETAIGRHGSTSWMLLGHSMGGKVASIVASRTLNGSNGLFGLRGVVLMAASPLSPEPMDDERRESMRSWAEHGPISAEHADEFLDANTAHPLTGEARDIARDDVQRTQPEAWLAWLDRGSIEDWSESFEVNPAPALILAGAEDGDLGPEAQEELNLPHWEAAELAVVPDAAHLMTWEQPDTVARLITQFWSSRVDHGPEVPEAWARVIASPRTSGRMRGILARRALPDDPTFTASVLTERQLETLRAVADLVVPQPQGGTIDIALRVAAQLVTGGDGWRQSGQPTDAEAYRNALDDLESAMGGDRSPDERAETLAAISAGEYEPDGRMSASQLQAWLEDATDDLVRQWLAHPATMASLDYDGFANGGDGVRKQGFQLLTANSREAWEPQPQEWE